MSWPLPRAVAQDRGVSLQATDFTIVDAQVTTPATGTARIDFDPVESGYLWRVERVVVTSTNSNVNANITVSLYGGDIAAIKLRDSSPMPAGFEAVFEYPVLLTILPGTNLIVNVTGGAPGDVITASVQYQLVQRTAAA